MRYIACSFRSVNNRDLKDLTIKSAGYFLNIFVKLVKSCPFTVSNIINLVEGFFFIYNSRKMVSLNNIINISEIP
jgi:hypothetical protein